MAGWAEVLCREGRLSVVISRTAVLAVAAFLVLPGAGNAAAATQTFSSTGDFPFVVPSGVFRITTTAIGAAGGGCFEGATGGRGASVTATVAVLPGEHLVVGVGGAGGSCEHSTGSGAGGAGGGGAGAAGDDTDADGGGGGASVLAPGVTAPEFSRALIVAGGGGGATEGSSPLNGGDAGSSGADGPTLGSGGGAGTQSAGGAGGLAGSTEAQAGFPGTLGTGGAGGTGDDTGTSIGGGGGGGGYYGGGGGGGGGVFENSGSGGGGSSYVIPGATAATSPTVTSEAPSVALAYQPAVAPTATISSPASGGTYTLDESVPTTFTCAEGTAGTGLSSCDDSNATNTTSGGTGHLDTSTAGAHTYMVSATSHDGLTGVTSISYTVLAPPVIVPPPVITGARVTHRRFRVSPKHTAVSAAGGSRAPLGTAFDFTISAASKLEITIVRVSPGLHKGSKCVAPAATLKRRHAHTCTRLILAGSLSRATESQGSDSIAFSGRLGRRALRPGSYRATLVARGAGGSSKPVTVLFTIVP
jgi:hypothetical protein